LAAIDEKMGAFGGELTMTILRGKTTYKFRVPVKSPASIIDIADTAQEAAESNNILWKGHTLKINAEPSPKKKAQWAKLGPVARWAESNLPAMGYTVKCDFGRGLNVSIADPQGASWMLVNVDEQCEYQWNQTCLGGLQKTSSEILAECE